VAALFDLTKSNLRISVRIRPSKSSNKASISGNNQTVSICTYENNRSLYVLPSVM
jgi:hypothetical protein